MRTTDSKPCWTIIEGDGPLVAAAVHDGHVSRGEVFDLFAISESDRLREEDPFTGEWAAVAPTRVVGLNSRFEVDLNRPREKAVYVKPEDAWGLHVWKNTPSKDLVARSLAIYDDFYADVERVLRGVEQRHGRFVLFDLHTYNHRRDGPRGPEADPKSNPQVNLGTGTMNRSRWGSIVDRFTHDLSSFDFPGGKLDVRENVKFKGGNFSRWVHEKFPETGCSLAIEFKKFFMDEWTGEPDAGKKQAIRRSLEATVSGVLEELRKLDVQGDRPRVRAKSNGDS